MKLHSRVQTSLREIRRNFGARARVGGARARQRSRRGELPVMARPLHAPLKDYPMMMNNTLAQLRELKLVGMASAIEEQLSSSASTALCFEERLALMVDREVHHRGDKRRAALLKKAGLKYSQASIEDVDGRAGRGFERSAMMSLALSRWVEDGTPILAQPDRANRGWHVHLRSTRADAVTRRCICVPRAWPRSCASCTATAASLAGSPPSRAPTSWCLTTGDLLHWMARHART